MDNFNRSDEKMKKIINDIDDAIKCSKKYSDFKLILKAKGYENNKSSILKEIKQLSEKIDTLQARKNACNRIIDRYATIKSDYKNEIEAKNKATELIKEDKKKNSRYR